MNLKFKFFLKILIFSLIIPILISGYNIVETKNNFYKIETGGRVVSLVNYSSYDLDKSIKYLNRLLELIKIDVKDINAVILNDRIQLVIKIDNDFKYKDYNIGNKLPNGISIYLDKDEDKIFYNFFGIDEEKKLVKIEGEFKDFDSLFERVKFILYDRLKKIEFKKEIIEEEEKKEYSNFFNPKLLYLYIGSGTLFSVNWHFLGYGFGKTFLEFGTEVGFIQGVRKEETDPNVYNEYDSFAFTFGGKLNYTIFPYKSIATYLTTRLFYGIGVMHYNSRPSIFLGVGQKFFDFMFLEFGVCLSGENKGTKNLVFGFGLFFYLDRKY